MRRLLEEKGNSHVPFFQLPALNIVFLPAVDASFRLNTIFFPGASPAADGSRDVCHREDKATVTLRQAPAGLPWCPTKLMTGNIGKESETK